MDSHLPFTCEAALCHVRRQAPYRWTPTCHLHVRPLCAIPCSTALCPGETPGGDGMLDRLTAITAAPPCVQERCQAVTACWTLTAVPAAPPCVQERRQAVWGDQFGWGEDVRRNELKQSHSRPLSDF
ncbi:hypothetical protein ACOMHN_031171 [Nucella lapillus]